MTRSIGLGSVACIAVRKGSKVVTTLALGSNNPPSMIPPLLIRYLTGAVVDHVATQCQCQGRLLGEAKRDLEVLKKAHCKAERDMENLEERFERELQAANYEIRQLKVRFFAPPYLT